jgi:hypothetical protein
MFYQDHLSMDGIELATLVVLLPLGECCSYITVVISVWTLDA